MIRSVSLARHDARVLLVGGIVGLSEERTEVERLLGSEAFDAVLLGIPFEDLDAIRATSGKETAHEFERDDMDEFYFASLANYGEVKVPPGDLYAAFHHASQRGLRIEAIDVGDEGHTALWTEHVGMFELMKNNRRLKRLEKEPFAARNAEEFAREWDEKIFPTKGLRRVQEEREAWMAKRIQDVTATSRRAFALVPLARWAGVQRRLLGGGWSAAASESARPTPGNR